MKKICVIYTGGTIGSAYRGDGSVGTDGGAGGALTAMYKEKYGTEAEFDECRPLDVLSENMQKNDLVCLADCLREKLRGEYAGVVVTHGTDTLSFTAPLFALLFCDARLPVVFVSALYPLADERSNGPDNFAAAVDFIGEGLPGVFVAFRNAGESFARIHLASRLSDCAPVTGDFSSFGGVPFGVWSDGKFKYLADPVNPTADELRAERAPCGLTAQDLCTDILTVKAHSLTDYSLYGLSAKKPRAVVLELYHSGTICTAGGGNAANFLRLCREKGVPAVLSPVLRGGNVYESATELAALAEIFYDESFQMSRVKAMLALGAGMPLKDVSERNFFFEKVAPRA